MKVSKIYLTLGIGLFLMILCATLTGEKFSWTLSPFYIIGFFLIITGWSGTVLVDSWRGKTNQVFSNRGHVSIRLKDIFTIPYQEPMPEDVEKKVSLGSMKIMLTGGFDIGLPWGWSMPGPKEAPVYIFPAIQCEPEQNDFHVHTNLTIYTLENLPSYLREELQGLNKLPESKDRIHPTLTPICYGTTSHMDGSATPENLRIERERKHENKELAEAEKREDRLYKVMRKQKEASEKQYIIGKPIKPIEDES